MGELHFIIAERVVNFEQGATKEKALLEISNNDILKACLR